MSANPDTPAGDAGSASGNEAEELQKALSESKERTERLEADLQQQKVANEQFTAKLKTLEEDQKKPDPPKEYSRTELSGLVEQGRISEAQQDQILEQQTERRITDKLTKEFTEREATQRQNAELTRQGDEYRKLVPDLAVQGSEAWSKAQQSYRELIAQGHADDLKTEVLAIRMAHGPIDRIQETTQKHLQTHEETGGVGDEAEPTKGVPRGVTKRLQSFYKKQIERGLYTGWDDPKLKKELSYAKT
jgi:hypothetical protein